MDRKQTKKNLIYSAYKRDVWSNLKLRTRNKRVKKYKPNTYQERTSTLIFLTISVGYPGLNILNLCETPTTHTHIHAHIIYWCQVD